MVYSASEIPFWIANRIQAAIDQKLPKLDLSFPDDTNDDDKLDHIPDKVFELTCIRQLDVTGHNINSISESIGKLENLNKLILGENSIEELPESIGQLKNLTSLVLKGNKIKVLPESIGELTNLEYLFLNRNLIATIPNSIARLTKLTTLFIQDNIIAIFPRWIGKLTKLTNLNLSNNFLQAIPECIGKLTKLAKLNLSKNEIKNIPVSISELSNLTDLDLSENKIENIPISISELSNSTNLDLSGNKIENIPISISELSNYNLINLKLNNNQGTTLFKDIIVNLLSLYEKEIYDAAYDLLLKNTSILKQYRNNSPKIIKIFLASSSELEKDRQEFQIFIGYKNDFYIERNIYLKLVLWENFIDAISATRLQDEYNKAVESCDIFVSLFHTKVSQYTEEEFLKALKTFKANGKPLIYTYFKEEAVDMSKIAPQIVSLVNFKQKLSDLGHNPTYYTNSNDLKYKFGEQLIKILPQLTNISKSHLD